MLEAVKEQTGGQESGAGGVGARGERAGQAGEGGRLPRDLRAFTRMRWSHRKVLSGEGWSLTQVFTGSVWQGGAWTLEVGQDWEEEELRVQGQRGQTGRTGGGGRKGKKSSGSGCLKGGDGRAC